MKTYLPSPRIVETASVYSCSTCAGFHMRYRLVFRMRHKFWFINMIFATFSIPDRRTRKYVRRKQTQTIARSHRNPPTFLFRTVLLYDDDDWVIANKSWAQKYLFFDFVSLFAMKSTRCMTMCAIELDANRLILTNFSRPMRFLGSLWSLSHFCYYQLLIKWRICCTKNRTSCGNII